MPYRKYPWHRFQYWLRQHPDNAIAGMRNSRYANVICRFLHDRTGRDFRVALARMNPIGPGDAAGDTPFWVGRFLELLDASGRREQYTFVTARRIMRQVSDEFRSEYS